jgi:hypothetical protein
MVVVVPTASLSCRPPKDVGFASHLVTGYGVIRGTNGAKKKRSQPATTRAPNAPTMNRVPRG